MTIVIAEAPFNAEHNGSAYHFCSMQCASSFNADADAYVICQVDPYDTVSLVVPGMALVHFDQHCPQLTHRCWNHLAADHGYGGRVPREVKIAEPRRGSNHDELRLTALSKAM